MIIPHIIDQFAWNKIIHQLGAGPKGIKIGKISVQGLEAKVLDLVNNSSYKKNAAAIAAKMVNADLEERLYEEVVA